MYGVILETEIGDYKNISEVFCSIWNCSTLACNPIIDTTGTRLHVLIGT
jgi:hypothetical protein